jgi:hypothetical protein
MPELERALTELASRVDYPPTPPISRAVGARLATAERAAPRRAPRFLGLPRALAAALVLLLLAAGAVVAAVPDARRVVLDFFGLRGATVERSDRRPPSRPSRELDLGRRTSLDRAAERLAFAPLVPRSLGTPDAVYLRTEAAGGELSLAYRPRPGLPRAPQTRLGLLVSQFRGDLEPEYVGKVAPQATSVERLRVNGHRSLWIEGAPHLFFYRPPRGRFAERNLRLAANVLLLERGRLLLRLEGAMSRERAVAIALSLRRVP